jgi:hypothetical protein
MKKKLLIDLLILLMLLIPVTSVQGQGVLPPIPPGGAAADPYPVPLTPEQIKVSTQKVEKLEKIKALKDKGISPGEIRTQVTLPTDMVFLFPQNSLSSDDSGYASMGLWKEPENQPNWCGPGSGMAVISNWRTVPPGGYTAESYMSHLASLMMSGQTTYISTWLSVVNNEIGYTFYVQGNPSTVASYISYMKSDIYYNGHPFNNLVDTVRLPGWAGYSASHYVAVYSYMITGSTSYLYYGDSAPDSANGSLTPNPYGWHSTGINNFYEDMDNYNPGYHYIMW